MDYICRTRSAHIKIQDLALPKLGEKTKNTKPVYFSLVQLWKLTKISDLDLHQFDPNINIRSSAEITIYLRNGMWNLDWPGTRPGFMGRRHGHVL